MPRKISDFIFEHSVIDVHSNFSTPEAIDDFFANLPSQAIKKWPFDFKPQGLKTKYLSAKVFPETWKQDAYFQIQAEVFDGSHRAIIEQKFHFQNDDNLVIDICSVHRSSSDAYPQKMKIAHILSDNNFNFLQAYDKYNKPKNASFMRIYASSELTKQNIQTCGGYVWANNGFDFQSPQELNRTRYALSSFLKHHNISITDKNLKLFTKPCHFAAYTCGLLINYQGHYYHAGKAFLLQHSWLGIQKTTSANNEEHRYAHAYYNEPLPALRRKRAFFQLSKKFRTFICNTKKKTLLDRIAYRFKTLRRLLSFKKFSQYWH